MSVINLKNYLRNVYEDLKGYVDGLTEEQRKEFVKKCNNYFDTGAGDYDNKYMVAFYILKYARAYGFQFSRAYADIFADMGHPDRVRAVSIGCGTGIDYWGMSHAARCLHKADGCNLDYTGIDPQIWAYRVSEAPDMPAMDTVRFNEVACQSEGHSETCNDFGDFLEIMEKNTGKSLDDIYLFGHSIKEVSVYTVPETQEKARKKGQVGNRKFTYYAYKYNPYQSMARFARLIRKRISDKPVYVAFTYRRSPDESLEKDMEFAEAYDTRYGTYFRTCVRQSGLNIELLEPVHVNSRYGVSLCRKESPDCCRESYFDYDELHSFTGAPDSDTSIWTLGKDRHGAFDGLYFGRSRGQNDTPICSLEEWNEAFVDDTGHVEKTMENLENMCYQVFRISVDNTAENHDIHMQEKNEYLDLIEEVMRDFEFDIHRWSNRLDFFINRIKRHLLNKDSTVGDMINWDSILEQFIVEGCIEVQSDGDDEKITYGTTEWGKRAGVYVKEDNIICVKSYAQQNIIANLVCGRYIDRRNEI